MPQIREIKRRIKSINNTQKVTHAMELVSAAKMRKTQEAALSSRPYATTLDEILNEVKVHAHKKGHKLLRLNAQSLPQMIILLTTDRGLVGGLNINVTRLVTAPNGPIAQLPANLKYVVVGKKGTAFTA